MVTIFKNIYSKEPHYISVEKALDRIRTGTSKTKIDNLRSVIDKERQDGLKRDLPSVCFSGKFGANRKDEEIIEHSGYLVLDFDDVSDVDGKKKEVFSKHFVKAAWVSPRNNGVKALVRISETSKHREHFNALRDIFPDADKSGVNPSRVCYESYDPDLLSRDDVKVFDKIKVDVFVERKKEVEDDRKVFENITKWLANRGDAFVTGERNHFIFKLASACCRFGLNEDSCAVMIMQGYSVGQDGFGINECKSAVKSAYKSNKHLFGTAHFEEGVLVDKTSRTEIVISKEMLDENIKPKDVVYAEDVKDSGMRLYDVGYERVNGIGVYLVDKHYKMKEGEITLLTGYGNYGKSTFQGWILLMRTLLYGEKFAFFSPENLSEDFYFDMIEILLGCDCTPKSKTRPSRDVFEAAWDWLGKRFFYVYPKDLSPTPEYIKERFLELIIKEKVKGVLIDPFNQLDNDYKSAGGARDKYLETFLGDYSRFARQNGIYGLITAHPRAPKSTGSDGNYKCPDVFEIADGAMWNNKMDNILVYHRPERQTNPDSDICEFHAKKIRRQKIVGSLGYSTFNYNRKTRRYTFAGNDPLEDVLNKMDLPFHKSAGVQASLYDFNSFNPENLEDSPF